MLAALAPLALACAATRESPMLSHEDSAVFTPQPTDTTASEVTAADEAEQGVLTGPIKLVQWDDNTVKLENAIAGYIMVHGFGYTVELLEMSDTGYQESLPKGDIDMVMEMAPDWYPKHVQSGSVVDAGTFYQANPDIRIGVHSSVSNRAPELVEFLGKISQGDELLADLAGRITGGRVGINANTAALIFLKNHESVWSQWVTEPVVENVQTAIEAGKASLLDRPCVPLGKGGYSDFHLKACFQ